MNKQVLIALMALNKANGKEFFRIKCGREIWAGMFFLSPQELKKACYGELPVFGIDSLLVQYSRVVEFFESKINFYIKNDLPVPQKVKNFSRKLTINFI